MPAKNQKRTTRLCDEDNEIIAVAIHELRGVAKLRSALLDLAYQVEERGFRGVLVLLEPAMTLQRIEKELDRFKLALKAGIGRNLSAHVIAKDGQVVAEWPRILDADLSHVARRLVKRVSTTNAYILPRPDSESLVWQVLADRWVIGNRAITAKALGEIVGYSYPTLARALSRLGPLVVKERDRRIRLARFSREDLLTLSVQAKHNRSTLTFRDEAEMGLSPEWLADHLIKLGRDDVAIGGAMAGRHYWPAMDLVGSPRLDLHVHAPASEVDLSFLRDINPALVPTDLTDDRCDLALHFVRSRHPMFDRDQQVWTSPISTMIDLSELRFASQSDGLRQFLSDSRRNG